MLGTWNKHLKIIIMNHWGLASSSGSISLSKF